MQRHSEYCVCVHARVCMQNTVWKTRERERCNKYTHNVYLLYSISCTTNPSGLKYIEESSMLCNAGIDCKNNFLTFVLPCLDGVLMSSSVTSKEGRSVIHIHSIANYLPF